MQPALTKKFLEQATCRNSSCRVTLLPVRFQIETGEIQVKCRSCKAVTLLTYTQGSLTYATVIAAP